MKTQQMDIHAHMTGVSKSAGHGSRTTKHIHPTPPMIHGTRHTVPMGPITPNPMRAKPGVDQDDNGVC